MLADVLRPVQVQGDFHLLRGRRARERVFEQQIFGRRRRQVRFRSFLRGRFRNRVFHYYRVFLTAAAALGLVAYIVPLRAVPLLEQAFRNRRIVRRPVVRRSSRRFADIIDLPHTGVPLELFRGVGGRFLDLAFLRGARLLRVGCGRSPGGETKQITSRNQHLASNGRA